jgi:hypothetical protein
MLKRRRDDDSSSSTDAPTEMDINSVDEKRPMAEKGEEEEEGNSSSMRTTSEPLKYRKMQTAYPCIRTAVDKVFSVEELIAYVMTFVPTCDKMKTLRLVCKDWNNAVCDSASWHSLRSNDVAINANGGKLIHEMLKPAAQILLTQLRVLDLRELVITEFDFRNTPFLEECMMSLTEDMLAQVLTVLPKLTHLHVSLNSCIGEPAVFAFLANVSKLRSLEWEYEGENNVSPLSSRFANAFGPSLQLLESYGGVLTQKMMRSLTEHCPPGLHSLSYQPKPVSMYADDTGSLCDLLAVVGPQLTGTLRVCVDHCDANLVMQAIYQHCTALSELCVYDNLDQDMCISFLFVDVGDAKDISVPRYPRLKVLEVKPSCVEDQHCGLLAQRCPALTTLKLTGPLTSPGIKELARGLRYLTRFYLNLTDGSDPGILLDALFYLARCPRMRYFELDNWSRYSPLHTIDPTSSDRSLVQSTIDYIRRQLNLLPFVCAGDFSPQWCE